MDLTKSSQGKPMKQNFRNENNQLVQKIIEPVKMTEQMSKIHLVRAGIGLRLTHDQYPLHSHFDVHIFLTGVKN